MLKRSVMVLVLLDNFLVNLTRRLFPARWRLTGGCRRCGGCCRRIILTMTPAQTKSDLFTDLSARWISWLFGFRLIEIDRPNGSLVFSCDHLTPQGLCGNYFWRPNVCRNYPLLDYFNEPKLLPGCGYRSEKTSAVNR